VQLASLRLNWERRGGDEDRRVERASEIAEWDAGCNMRRDGGEEVAAMEGVTAARSPPAFIIENNNGGNTAERLRGGEEESVVWADQHIAASATDRDRPALRPNARIHDRYMCANRKMHERLNERLSASFNVIWRDRVGEIKRSSIGSHR